MSIYKFRMSIEVINFSMLKWNLLFFPGHKMQILSDVLINTNYFTLNRLAYLKTMNSDLKRSNKTLSNRE